MRIRIFFMLGLLYSAQMAAQDTSSATPRYRHDVAVDATGLLPYFGGSGTGGFYGLSYPYYLNYRCHFRHGSIRYGIGVYGASSSTDGDQVYLQESWMVQQRIGFEWWSALAARWQVMYGVDLVNQFSRSVSRWQFDDGSVDERTDRMSGWGAGPVLGVRFRLVPRMWLGTETYWYVLRAEGKSDKTYSADPTYDEHTTRRTIESRYHFPVSLLVMFRF